MMEALMPDMARKAAENLTAVRETHPLVHNITNYVVMNYTANALLACGASPVMAHAEEEVAEMVSLAGALVLNIGTLSEPWVRSMIAAARRAAALKTPVILDPVGAGATGLRTAAARRILAVADVRVLRGNPSEILSLRDDASRTKGVDSLHGVDAAAEAARRLAAELNTTLAITGPVDLVTDGQREMRISNGHPLMSRVTGTGCTATALIGAFLAVEPDGVTAATSALAYFGLAGERAAQNAAGPGSFMIGLLDALYTLSPQELLEGCRIEA
jgi:hydroxyethylthiazole kinase